MVTMLLFVLLLASIVIMVYQAWRIRHMDQQIEQTINVLERSVTEVALAASDNTVTDRILTEEQLEELGGMPVHEQTFRHGVNVGVNYAVRVFDIHLESVEQMLDEDQTDPQTDA